MNDTLLEFPCDFPLKVVGRQTDAFRQAAGEIVERHAASTPEASERPSRDGRYIALSFSIRATSQQQLDDIYRELSACELVLFVL